MANPFRRANENAVVSGGIRPAQVGPGPGSTTTGPIKSKKTSEPTKPPMSVAAQMMAKMRPGSRNMMQAAMSGNSNAVAIMGQSGFDYFKRQVAAREKKKA